MKRHLFSLLCCGLLCLTTAQAQLQELTEIERTDSARVDSRAVPNRTSAQLTVQTNTSNVECYLNNEYQGKTPLTIYNIISGSYLVRLSKEGYYDREFYLDLNTGTDNTLYVELRKKTGIISFIISPPGASVFIDGQAQAGTEFELSEGVYTASVRAFGYETQTMPVTVFRRQRNTIAITLKPAVFTITGFTAPQKKFNPQNPGRLGKLRLQISVNAPGNGKLSIADDSGNQVAHFPLSSFTTWDQTIYWDGKASDGKPVPDGNYTATILATGINNQTDTITAAVTFAVDSTLTYPLHSISAAGGSVGLNASPLMFPAGTVFTGITASASGALTENGFYAVPLYAGILYAPLSWLEIGARAGVSIAKGNVNPLNISAVIKMGSSVGNFLYAGFIRYGYTQTAGVLPYSESGLAPGAVLGLRIADFTLSANAEFVMGQEQGVLAPFTLGWTTGISAQFQRRVFSCGIWAKTQNAVTWLTGVDSLFFIPDTNIMLNLQYFAGWNPQPFMGGGIGLMLLF